MKRKVLILYFIVFIFSFGEIKDNLKLFKDEEIALLNEKIEAFQDKNQISVFVNTDNFNEGEEVQRPERTIIINLEKNSENKLVVTDNFTQDLSLDQFEEEVNSLIDGLGTLIEEKDYSNYVIELLDGVQTILDKRTFVEGESFQFTDNKWEIIKWIAIVLTFLNILGRIRYVSKMKKAKQLENQRKEKSKKNWKSKKRVNSSSSKKVTTEEKK